MVSPMGLHPAWGQLTQFLSAHPSKQLSRSRRPRCVVFRCGGLWLLEKTRQGLKNASAFPYPYPPAPVLVTAVLHRGRGRQVVERRKLRSMGGRKAKGPGFHRREFSSSTWMQTGSRGSKPTSSRAVRSGRAAGMQAALPRHGLLPGSSLHRPAARPNHSRGITSNNPFLSRLLGQASGPRDQLQRTGE